MRRTELREHIVRIVFQTEFHAADQMDQQAEYYLDMLQDLGEKDRIYMKEKSGKIVEKLPEIDKLLNHSSTGWSTKRMNKADLAILRVAVYEIRWDEEVPTGVAINEAVELCHRYDADEGASFVNGILATISKLENEE